MINTTNIKVPSKYKDGVKRIYKDEDGYWLYANNGWFISDYDPQSFMQSVCEDNASDILTHVRSLRRTDNELCR